LTLITHLRSHPQIVASSGEQIKCSR
jgi:hypothetical protein